MIELPKVKNANLWDQTYNILKENIIKRKFAPNQKLSISHLVKQLGISNTPIRDALIRLEMEGLVTTVSKVGTYINAITGQNVIHTMDTRLMLEFWVADHLAMLPKDQIKRSIGPLDAILQHALEKIESVSLNEFINFDYNFQFHMEYMKLGENPKNVEIYANLMNYRHVLIGTSAETHESKRFAVIQHQMIIDAVKEGTVYDIKTTVRNHLEGSKTRLLQLIESKGGCI